MNPVLSAIFRQKIALPTASGYSFFTIAHILYFHAEGKEAKLFIFNGIDEPSHCRVFKGLKELETSLSSCGFLRIRRDILLNTLAIKTVCKDGSILLSSGEVVHPSRDRLKVVERYLKEYYYI